MTIVAIVACHASRSAESTLEDLTRARSADERVDAIARKCARIASCAHPHDAPRFRDPRVCVDDWLERMGGPAHPVLDCLSSAATCKDVEACLHGAGDPRAASFCAAHPGTVSACDGDALIGCVLDDLGESSLTSCAPLGATCGEVRTAGGLIERGCLSPSACPEGATRARCDGDGVVVACRDQIEERTVCEAGTTCHAHKDDDGEELATCEAPGDARVLRSGSDRADRVRRSGPRALRERRERPGRALRGWPREAPPMVTAPRTRRRPRAPFVR